MKVTVFSNLLPTGEEQNETLTFTSVFTTRLFGMNPGPSHVLNLECCTEFDAYWTISRGGNNQYCLKRVDTLHLPTRTSEKILPQALLVCRT